MCMAIITKDKKLLLTKRSDKLIFPNAWVLPGGHLDPGESLEECARREIKEECGIQIDGPVDEFMIFESASGRAEGT